MRAAEGRAAEVMAAEEMAEGMAVAARGEATVPVGLAAVKAAEARVEAKAAAVRVEVRAAVVRAAVAPP